jgi:hypothetical protein
MTRRSKLELELENKGLHERLEEAESTLHAIQDGSVDAFVVSKSGFTQVLTLKGTDYLYRVFVESMNDDKVKVKIFSQFMEDPMQTSESKLIPLGIFFQNSSMVRKY